MRWSRDYRNADYKGICRFLGRVNWNEIFETCHTTNHFYDSFSCVLNSAVEVFVPRKRDKVCRSVRLPRKLRNLRKRKKIL